jgi:hypothetical protein
VALVYATMLAVSTTRGTAGETSRRLTRLEVELERRETFAGYARLYGGVSVAALFLLFLPILEDVTEKDNGSVYHYRYGTLWEMSEGNGGDPAVLGIVLALALIGLTAIAAFRPLSVGLPVAIAAVSALIVLMLIVRPGTGEPVPGRTAEGNAGLAVSIGVGLLAIAHAVHYGRWARQASARI